MKQLTCFLLLLTVSFQLSAQIDSTVTDTLKKEDYLTRANSQNMQPAELKAYKTDYLAKSKWQRTTGWILTGTGMTLTSIWLVLAITDVVVEATTLITSVVSLGGDTPETHSKNRSALLITGTAMGLAGTTFLIISRINKKKALSISFINETSQQLRFNMVMNTSVPSVRLRLQF